MDALKKIMTDMRKSDELTKFQSKQKELNDLKRDLMRVESHIKKIQDTRAQIFTMKELRHSAIYTESIEHALKLVERIGTEHRNGFKATSPVGQRKRERPNVFFMTASFELTSTKLIHLLRHDKKYLTAEVKRAEKNLQG